MNELYSFKGILGVFHGQTSEENMALKESTYETPLTGGDDTFSGGLFTKPITKEPKLIQVFNDDVTPKEKIEVVASYEFNAGFYDITISQGDVIANAIINVMSW